MRPDGSSDAAVRGEGQTHLKRPIQLIPGAGAAGGLGFALLSLGAKIIPGAQVVEQITGLRRSVEQADWVITGEGRSDRQTLFGKLPMHVAEVARQAGVRTILISGLWRKFAANLTDSPGLIYKLYIKI